MYQFVQTRWFELIDLILALTSGILFVLWPGLGYWPILLALLPWVTRLAAGRFPFKRGVFDLPLALFLCTAGVGVWTAYDRESAWLKFFILVAAVLVFYALAGQPNKNLVAAAWLLSFVGVSLALYFLVSFDWQSEDIGSIDQIASYWKAFRPELGLVALPPNTIGGILAMLFPITLVPVILEWQSHRFNRVVLSSIAAGIVLFGLLMTSSRGAWLALLAASGFWVVWKASDIISRRISFPRARLLVFMLALLLAGVLFMLRVYPYGVTAALEWLPGVPSGESRLELARNTLDLIADFAWTGAGLTSFGGIYSQYIRVIPFFFYAYSHNLYLDITLEQGVIALLLGLGIFLGAGWWFIVKLEDPDWKSSPHLLAAAGLTALITLLIHGLMDDALYGVRGTPFLFLLPGLAVAVMGDVVDRSPAQSGEPVNQLPGRISQKPGVWAFLAGFLIIILLFISPGGKVLLASWYANLGAVEMARQELAGWPLGKWNTDPDISAYAKAEDLFQHSLSLDPDGATAHYRLGLIAFQGRYFEAAQYHLEKALLQDPDHRGIRKVLGYVYVWNDQPDKAASILKTIPEADREMRHYAIWWKKLGRHDLALKSKSMQKMFLEMKDADQQTLMNQQ